ncbi:DUF4019 domain-containing protein [Vreelandella arcis]|uniref:DUF4019 domain-containing protein n=1 Tax=Vreelandella arcis TaxID=416873 RepID=A0A1H0EUE6_9GAMM|nr:DUF4019 domain-containing protein [Halomonas arcis]SDN86067.1 Protein of unknown function [Halomonas arcis]
MLKTLTLCITAALLVLPMPAYSHTNEAEAAALAWLEAVDNGNYEHAWETSSTLLQAPLSAGMLARTVELARRDFGEVESRKRVRVTREKSMPGAPEGDYAVYMFQTRFENQSGIIETVTPYLEGGTWKVSGYYVE